MNLAEPSEELWRFYYAIGWKDQCDLIATSLDAMLEVEASNQLLVKLDDLQIKYDLLEAALLHVSAQMQVENRPYLAEAISEFTANPFDNFENEFDRAIDRDAP